MEARYLAALAGILHIFCLLAVTWSRTADTPVWLWNILWTPCAIGAIFFLLTIALLVPVVYGMIAPFWLLLSLLELAHCSEVDGLFISLIIGG
jgi:hypothetical protein